MDQQRGVDRRGIGRHQGLELGREIRQQSLGGLRPADGVADLILDVHGFRERTEIEADDRLFQPLPRVCDDLLGRIHTGCYCNGRAVHF